jgi:hypothetical protein
MFKATVNVCYVGVNKDANAVSFLHWLSTEGFVNGRSNN